MANSWNEWAEEIGRVLDESPVRVDLRTTLGTVFVVVDEPSQPRASGETVELLRDEVERVRAAGADGFVWRAVDGRVSIAPIADVGDREVDAVVEIVDDSLRRLVTEPRQFDVLTESGTGQLTIAGSGYLGEQLVVGPWRRVPESDPMADAFGRVSVPG